MRFSLQCYGVHLQRETRSSLVPKVSQNTFIASDKRVHLEVSSRDYLVASDECVRLQCDIVNGLVFGGDPGFPRLAREQVYTNYH